MKLQVLSDNRAMHDDVVTEHGLCIYLEADSYKCLLDTGASDVFIRNAANMHIDLVDIDYVFISHGHSDHLGGLEAFLEMNKKAKIVVARHALTQRFFSTRNGVKEISACLNLERWEDRFVYVDAEMQFENEIRVLPHCVRTHPMPKANATLFKKTEDEMQLDDFNHELIVCFGVGKLLIYTGCAHGGVLNMLQSVTQVVPKPIACVIGGFHLLDGYDGQYETEAELVTLASQLMKTYPSASYYTGHCTGDKAYQQLRTILSDRLQQFYAGFTLDVSIH